MYFLTISYVEFHRDNCIDKY